MPNHRRNENTAIGMEMASFSLQLYLEIHAGCIF